MYKSNEPGSAVGPSLPSRLLGLAVLSVGATAILTACAVTPTEDGQGGENAEAIGSSQSEISATGCAFQDQTLKEWMANHMALVNAMLANRIPFDKSSLIKVSVPGQSVANIELSSALASKDKSYKVRGVLEIINAHTESRTHLNLIRDTLPLSGGAVFSNVPEKFAAECDGTRMSFADAPARVLWKYRLRVSPTEWNTFSTKVRSPFKTVSLTTFPYDTLPNYMFVTSSSTTVTPDYAEFDPVASPDGFAVPAASGSCTTYGVSAISTDATDSRFYGGGACDSLTGSGCTSCNLDGESTCSSRVVWRRVGSSSAWRCRAN